MAIPNDEKETTCIYDYKTKKWLVYTCVPNHITKLLKISEPIWKEEEPDSDGKPRIIAGKWDLGKSQVRFAKIVERKEKTPGVIESIDEGDDEDEFDDDEQGDGSDSEEIAV